MLYCNGVCTSSLPCWEGRLMFYTSDSYDGRKDTVWKTEMCYSHAAERGGCTGISLGEENGVWSWELKDTELSCISRQNSHVFTALTVETMLRESQHYRTQVTRGLNGRKGWGPSAADRDCAKPHSWWGAAFRPPAPRTLCLLTQELPRYLSFCLTAAKPPMSFVFGDRDLAGH